MGLALSCGRWEEGAAGDAALLLPGTERVSSQNEVGFSLSPDGTRLFLEAEPTAGEPAFLFYDLSARRPVPIGWTEEARAALQGAALLTWQLACWSADSQAVHAQAEGGPLVARWTAQGARWDRLDRMPRVLVSAQRGDPGVHLRFDSQPGRVEVRGAGQPGKLLATHVPREALRSGVVVLERSVCVSAEGTFAAYALSETSGSFASPARLFVLPLDATEAAPLRLSRAAYGIPQWLPGSTALLFLQDERGGERGIYLWKP